MNEAGGAPADAAIAEPDTPGGMLRAERERRGYSVQYAAEDLHLDVWVIEALEANQFEALGAPVYARGHLRKYAMLLGLSAPAVLERYEALSGTPTEPTPIPAAMTAPVPQRRSLPKLPLWIAAVVALAAAAAWLVYELWPGMLAFDVTTSREVPVATAPQQSPGEPPPVEPGTAPVEQAPAPAASAAAAPVEAAPSSRDAQIHLRLEFSEPSWTEIYDANGRRLMFDMGLPGRVRTVAGTAPLRVNLGLAAAVSAEVDEQPIVIPRRAGRDGARFLIEADGSVRPDSSETAERN